MRVGNVFLNIDADQTRIDVEFEAMAMAPVPVPVPIPIPIPIPEILWWKPPVLTLAALPGTALGHLGEPSTASSVAGAEGGDGANSFSREGRGEFVDYGDKAM